MADYSKKFISGALVMFAANVLAAVFSYLMRFFMTANMSPLDYALFWSSFSLIGLIIVFSDFGLTHSIIYHTSKLKAHRKHSCIRNYITIGFAMQLVLGAVISAVIFLLSGFIASTYLHTYPNSALAIQVIQVLAIGLFLGIFLNNITAIFQGFQKIRLAALGEFFRVTLWFLFTVAFISFGFSALAPALGLICAYALLAIAFSGPVMKLIPKGRFKWDWKIAKELSVYGFPIMISLSIGYIVTYTDNIMVTILRGLSDASLYQTAQPTTTLLWFFSGAVITALFPLVAEMKAKKSKGLKEGIALIYKYVWLAIVPAAFIMFSFSTEILGILFGPAYIGGSNVLKILSIGAIVFSITQINGSILNALGKPDGYRDVVIKGAVLNIFGNILLIPFIGIEGAAISTVASYTLMLVGSHIELKKELKIKLPVEAGIKTLLAGLVSVIALYYFKSIFVAGVFVKIFAGMAVFSAIFSILIFALRVVTLKEITDLIKKGLSK